MNCKHCEKEHVTHTWMGVCRVCNEQGCRLCLYLENMYPIHHECVKPALSREELLARYKKRFGVGAKENGCAVPECNAVVDIETLRDDESKREYMISGLCQNCQDSAFEG